MADSATVPVSAPNVPAHKLKKISKSSPLSTNEPKMPVIKENSLFRNARQGKQK